MGDAHASAHATASPDLRGDRVPAWCTLWVSNGELGACDCQRNATWRIISAEPDLAYYLSCNRAHLSLLAAAGRRELLEREIVK